MPTIILIVFINDTQRIFTHFQMKITDILITMQLQIYNKTRCTGLQLVERQMHRGWFRATQKQRVRDWNHTWLFFVTASQSSTRRTFSPALCSHLGNLPVLSSLAFAFLFVFVLAFLFLFAFAFTTPTHVHAKPGPLTSSHLDSLFIYIVNF